jgi:hypothetical protein
MDNKKRSALECYTRCEKNFKCNKIEQTNLGFYGDLRSTCEMLRFACISQCMTEHSQNSQFPEELEMNFYQQ